MRGRHTERKNEAATDGGPDGLKRPLLVFAIIEAAILIPVLLYLIFR